MGTTQSVPGFFVQDVAKPELPLTNVMILVADYLLLS